MIGPRHLLLIPDGSRRHARRAYLCDLLRQNPAHFRAALAELPSERARALEERILSCLDHGEGADRVDQRDGLDDLAAAIPAAYLLASYRQGVELIDALLYRLLERGGLGELSIYGMQVRNLNRSDDEVAAFLRAELECCRRWAGDQTTSKRCAFRFIGDRDVFNEQRGRPNLVPLIEEFLEATTELEKASAGSSFRVNILAPYDYEWEINQAIVDGRFDPDRLAVRQEVDLVVRSGGDRRSLSSGAMPCQVAYSQFSTIGRYFPDCSVEDIERAILRYEGRERSSGL